MTHNLIRAIPQSYEFSSPHRCHHLQASPKISDRSALYLYLGPSNLRKKAQCSISTKALPCTILKALSRIILKTVPHTILKTVSHIMLKLAPHTILIVISYDKVLVDNDLTISTGKY